ncbi:type II secretion system minor pseudopilin GspK [Klebsiella pneumoniae]|uniref:type II secretion system minor pseudopilin GspK n=2 Tax=Klebsiella pneumoniae TaxID=573 RepID=UPI00049EB363|nr:type II secretion system minor pseudopilin GspK [Klebsiella pneumoniae]AKE77544.1 Putative general secretion pathway protein K [Klebsiella pneumoniae subsp. pneumoniae]EIW8470497.1 general secretion pathway protein GspK [Klebsiella pneumoniae]EIX9367579.1 type II secretion system minor pseudopilin GspK [Klebsiella pneumoniae]EKJ7335902.1 type II secretion system minor pseudopilin GspK [Klebsiella pneumoniae]EKX6496194.1 type II secretion system minor pseudopilin GspK [Klebsiella pneumoniae]
MKNRQRGVALLMVLFILALMMILASAMTERTAVMYQHTAVTLDNLQARWYALAAENMAAALLQRDALDSPSQTNLAQTWAQEGRRFTLDDGEIRATIRDGHACFNLNAIDHRADEAGDGMPYPTDVFVRLLALLGEPPLRASQIAAALGDWTDSDGQPRLNGAEDEVYMAQTPGYLAANQPMQDVSELRLLAGMDAALYLRLLPFVCVQPDDALQVNVNTLRPSQAALLVALFPGDLTLQEAQRLLHNRPRTGWSSVAAFLAQPTLQKTDTTLARPWLTVHSTRFIAAFTVVTGNLRFQLHSVLQQSGRTFTVVQRRYGLSMVVDEQD